MAAVANPESGLDADERIAIVNESNNEVVGSARRAEMVSGRWEVVSLRAVAGRLKNKLVQALGCVHTHTCFLRTSCTAVVFACSHIHQGKDTRGDATRVMSRMATNDAVTAVVELHRRNSNQQYSCTTIRPRVVVILIS